MGKPIIDGHGVTWTQGPTTRWTYLSGHRGMIPETADLWRAQEAFMAALGVKEMTVSAEIDGEDVKVRIEELEGG